MKYNKQWVHLIFLVIGEGSGSGGLCIFGEYSLVSPNRQQVVEIEISGLLNVQTSGCCPYVSHCVCAGGEYLSAAEAESSTAESEKISNYVNTCYSQSAAAVVEAGAVRHFTTDFR